MWSVYSTFFCIFAKIKIMDTEKLLQAIERATGGSFIPERYSSTCLGWLQNYDEEGRPLNCDPNIKTGEITIGGETYTLSRAGWHVSVKKNGKIITTKDLTPDYLK